MGYGRAGGAGSSADPGHGRDLSRSLPIWSSCDAWRYGAPQVALGPGGAEDIDLVLVGSRPIAHIERALVRVLEPLLGKPTGRALAFLKVAARNLALPSKIRRLTYTYVPTVAPPSEMKIKIEVNFNERDPCYDLANFSYTPPLPELDGTVVLKSYALDEMLGTKMRALFQRTQGRDLFDLDRACVRHDENVARGASPQVDPERVVGAFATYMGREGVKVTRSQFDKSLREKISVRAFRADMSKVLPPGIDYDIDVAAERVRDVLIARIPE